LRLAVKGWGIFELHSWRPNLLAECKVRGEGNMIDERNTNPAADTPEWLGASAAGVPKLR
jgi:hypothetical protein